MKNNYPIKYASMPIYGEGRNEQNDSPKAYIVSKCFLLDEHKRYSVNGDIDIRYEVVFPFQREDINNWKRMEPEYNYMTYQCVNSSIVNNIYNNKREATKNTNIKNEAIITKEIVSIPIDNMWIDKAKEKEKELKQEFKHYRKLENEIDDKTSDMEVNMKSNEQTIVMSSKNTTRISHSSIYDGINVWNGKKYTVYSLTEEEFQELLVDVKKGRKLDKFNKNSIIVNNPKKKMCKIYKNSETFYLNSNGLHSVQELNIDDNEFDEDKSAMNLYTVETYEDIIKSYLSCYGSDDELILNNKVLAKRIHFE